MTTMTHTELSDGNRSVHFDGQLIGSATSEYGYHGHHKARWTEFEIYLTDEGTYVIAKVGRSRIVHSTERCRVLKNNEDPLEKVDLDEEGADWEFCDPNISPHEQCWTDASLERASYGYLENDHTTVTLADNPQGAVSTCYSRDFMGVFSISWLAKKALERAFIHDQALESAYQNFDISQLSRRNR